MKISIITVAFNSERTIRDAINSVLSQTYQNIEYIIIDGKSTDQTAEIVRSYGDRIDQFISEPDDGLYDAMNKGVKFATGEVIGILNSDDLYKSSDILQVVVDNFKSSSIDCLYADLEYVENHNINKVVRFWKSKDYKEGLFQKGWHPAHPTFFVKREAFDKYGLFDLNYPIAADYELMLRFLEKHKLYSKYINKTFVSMRLGGVSNKSLLNIAKANFQCYKAWKNHDLKINLLSFLLKPVSKLLQFIKKET